MAPAATKYLLLTPSDVPARSSDWEIIGAFNPGVAEIDGRVAMLVRVAERPRECRGGCVGLPRWIAGTGPVIDWASQDAIEFLDPRVVRIRETGLVRLTFVSHLQICWLRRATNRFCVDEWGVRFEPVHEWEEYGVEDPRITFLDGRYWVTYVAVSRHGVVTALASTTDFQSFERHGILFPTENKDVVLFPERIGEDVVALHRPNGCTPFARPSMWLARSPDFVHWGQHQPLFTGRSEWETSRVGAGAPPLRIGQGWLEIYHGNHPTPRSEANSVGAYHGAAMLLDRDRPERILARSNEPVLSPSEPYEREGFVPNVVFPTAVFQRGEMLEIFYGAADTNVAVAELPLQSVVGSLAPLD